MFAASTLRALLCSDTLSAPRVRDSVLIIGCIRLDSRLRRTVCGNCIRGCSAYARNRRPLGAGRGSWQYSRIGAPQRTPLVGDGPGDRAGRGPRCRESAFRSGGYGPFNCRIRSALFLAASDLRGVFCNENGVEFHADRTIPRYRACSTHYLSERQSWHPQNARCRSNSPNSCFVYNHDCRRASRYTAPA